MYFHYCFIKHKKYREGFETSKLCVIIKENNDRLILTFSAFLVLKTL